MLALEWFFQLRQQAATGVTLKRISFQQLCQRYLATVIGAAKLGYHSNTIERHLTPFFGDIDDIRRITQGTVSDYVVHRRQKHAEKEPTPQTLNRESTVLRQMLNYAHLQRWLTEPIIVPHVSQRLSVRRRRHFTQEEYVTLWRVARRRIIEAANDPQYRHVTDNRRLLLDVILLMANSGLRVDEMHDMTWRNVLWTQTAIQLERAGKMKSSRKLILRRSAAIALERIATRRRNYLHQQGLPAELNPNDPVIATPDGYAVASVKIAFRSLLIACGFQYTSAEERHSLTSLRHSYATFALTRRNRRRPTLDILARQMGTSIRMIQLHYGHDSIEDYRDILSGSR
jgi:integrase